MSKLFAASFCVLALSFAAGFAADPKPGAPTEAAASRSFSGPNCDQPDQVVEHLLKAAEHLEAAGRAEEAARLRDDAMRRPIGNDVLSRKEAELECLAEAVDRLRELAGQAPGVVIDVVAIEVDRSKLGLKVREFDKMVGFAQAQSEVASASKGGSATEAQKISGSSSVVEANPFHLPLFRELREKGAIDVLAHPTVRTVTRRPTSISVGGHIPIRVKSPAGEFSLRRVPIGTQIEVVPVVLPNQRIRLQACVELTKISGDSVTDDDGEIHPQISSRRFNTEIEMQLGQTLAVGRWIFDRSADAQPGDDKTSQRGTIKPVAHAYASSESVETVVFITPRLVQSVGTLQALPVEPASRFGDADEANLPDDLSPTDGDVFGPVVPVLKRRTTGHE